MLRPSRRLVERLFSSLDLLSFRRIAKQDSLCRRPVRVAATVCCARGVRASPKRHIQRASTWGSAKASTDIPPVTFLRTFRYQDPPHNDFGCSRNKTLPSAPPRVYVLST